MSVIANDLNEDVYIGVGLPLSHNRDGFFKQTKTSLEQTKSNIKNLLLTRRGERLGNPTFGSDLFAVLFEQEGDDIESKVEEAIRSAMSEWLPFVIINNIETKFSITNKNAINVSMQFSLNVDTTTSEQLSMNISNVSLE
jgi:phage baseplate assembly protein W|tara:strand:+ start:385 stop:804 length:420 start_codon:yes stop_codon:yes gene_type:complete